jgi:hypothetical protein
LFISFTYLLLLHVVFCQLFFPPDKD